MEQVQIGNKTLNLLELDESNEDSMKKRIRVFLLSKFISAICFY